MRVWKPTIERNRQDGFTLVELMISLAIFAIVILGSYSSLLTTAAHSRIIENSVMARSAAQEVIEQLFVMPIGDLSAQDGLPFDFTGVPLQDPAIGQIGVVDISSSHGLSAGELYQINVSINHEGGDGVKSFSTSLTTYRAK